MRSILKILIPSILVIFLLFLATRFGHNRYATTSVACPPDFAQYSVPMYTGPIGAVQTDSNSQADPYMAQIQAATSSGVNFGGKYILVELDCGLSCQQHAIVHGPNGKILQFGLRSAQGIAFRPDSSLIVVNPATGSAYQNVTRYYTFYKDQLHYLCQTQP